MSKTRLSRERYDELLRAERIFTDLLPDLDKLEQCGEDCEGMKQVVREAMEQSAKLKQYFAPTAL